MNIEGMEKLIFTDVHFNMNVGLQTDNERERKKATTVYGMAQKICPIRQSWGEAVPISFELKFYMSFKPAFFLFFQFFGVFDTCVFWLTRISLKY